MASDDGLTYTFTLKDGIVFSNGNALTADDVQYTFERLLTAGGVNDDIPLEVVGAEALQNGEADTLEGFAVIDDTFFHHAQHRERRFPRRTHLSCYVHCG